MTRQCQLSTLHCCKRRSQSTLKLANQSLSALTRVENWLLPIIQSLWLSSKWHSGNLLPSSKKSFTGFRNSISTQKISWQPKKVIKLEKTRKLGPTTESTRFGLLNASMSRNIQDLTKMRTLMMLR